MGEASPIMRSKLIIQLITNNELNHGFQMRLFVVAEILNHRLNRRIAGGLVIEAHNLS